MEQETVWKSMYLTLLSGILEAGELLPVRLENTPAQERLNRAVRDAEELYLSGRDQADIP